MQIIKKFFNPILVVLLTITFIFIIQNNQTYRLGFHGIRYLHEFINSKSLQKKSFTNIKNTTKIIKKSYKGVLGGIAGVGVAANTLLNLRRKKNDEDPI